MKKHLLFYAGGLLILSAGCGGNKNSKEVVVETDTIVQTEVVEVATPVDSAAITAHYMAEHAKAKGSNKAKAKKQTTTKKESKDVFFDSHPPVIHHDVIAPQPATSTTPEVIVVHDVDLIYFIPDEKAKFPGGEKAFDEFLLKNLNYPQDALDRFVQGTVFVVVTLDVEGNVVKAECAGKRIGYGLEEEAERVLMSSPRWMPARHGGNTVKSKISLPITFEIKM
jgi:outer membrane biosynthesis protein TonB